MLRDRAIIAEMKGEVTSSKVCRGVAGSDWVTQTLIQDGGRGEVCGETETSIFSPLEREETNSLFLSAIFKSVSSF